MEDLGSCVRFYHDLPLHHSVGIGCGSAWGKRFHFFRSKQMTSSLGLAWDLQSLGVFNADMSHYMERSPPCNYYSSIDVDNEVDFSTGYLQDVLFEFTSKRRRLQLDTSTHSVWTSNFFQNGCQNLDSKFTQTISDMKTAEEDNSETYDSSSSSYKESADNQWTPQKPNLYWHNEKRKKRMLAKVVYPFALVKPEGLDGDVTLNAINERILMPPTRPVRHPVGDFACRPLISPDGLGLSGKVVVAFTRIHTQGRGTITIIRTRG